MEIHIKPICDPNYIDKQFPDWVVYQTGQFAKPEMILRDCDIKNIVISYCEYHGIKLTDKQEKTIV